MSVVFQRLTKKYTEVSLCLTEKNTDHQDTHEQKPQKRSVKTDLESPKKRSSNSPKRGHRVGDNPQSSSNVTFNSPPLQFNNFLFFGGGTQNNPKKLLYHCPRSLSFFKEIKLFLPYNFDNSNHFNYNWYII